MIANQIALIKREIWEHPAVYVTPLAIAIVVALLSIAGIVTINAFDKEVNMALFGASNVAGEAERQAALTIHFVVTSAIFLVALGILTIFYCLDSLYAERKDKSILFWRSLPITDAETVLSKLLTALIVLPAITVAVVIVTHLVNLIASSIWIAIKGGAAWHLIWGSAAFFDNWVAWLVFTLATSIWMSPFVGWFLFVSAYTKRLPLLMAFMPLILIPIFEWIFFDTKYFAIAVLDRGDLNPLLHGFDVDGIFDEETMRVSGEAISLLGRLDLAGFLASPSLWIGIAVCGLFTTGAIYIRRYRDDSQ